MATLYFAQREIIAKIVYFGAPGAGSNTNVRTLYGLVPAREKSRLHQFGPHDASEQSNYFDYSPSSGGEIPGFTLRYRVYSLPGGLRNQVHRHEVFDDLDGIVFVADARSSRAKGNALALEELTTLLRDQDVDLARIPLVLQVNHTDAEDARDPEEIGWLLNSQDFPVVSAVARSAVGVLETHEILSAEASKRLRANLSGDLEAIRLVHAKRDNVERDEEVIARHGAALEAAVRAPRPSLEMAISDFQVALTRRYQSLTPGPKFEVPVQPKEYVGFKPVHVIDARLDAEKIHVDLVMERLSGSGPRRLTLVLVNRPASEPAATRTTSSNPPPAVTGALPDKIDLPPPEPWDFPPVWYGIAGISGGIAAGLLLGFLVFG